MTDARTPARRMEAAGFTLQATDDGRTEIHTPSGRHIATLEWDRITLRPTAYMAHEIATLLIRYYSPGRGGGNM